MLSNTEDAPGVESLLMKRHDNIREKLLIGAQNERLLATFEEGGGIDSF